MFVCNDKKCGFKTADRKAIRDHVKRVHGAKSGRQHSIVRRNNYESGISGGYRVE